ncbi:hypothetical protein VE03_06953 [Pseudogymnoascus sp. 23342-1-I1]|nr:hypothetical protein VE03_06953 [Pseudogymnoascus sp. 23342-1-I1]
MDRRGRDASPNPWQITRAYGIAPDHSKRTHGASSGIRSTEFLGSSSSTRRTDATKRAGQLLGLFNLTPEEEVIDVDVPIFDLDVIAVHGFNGNARTTWTNKQGQLWLQQFLPYSLPKARIFTFGYDSLIFSQSNADIGDYARKLLSELNSVRQSEERQRRRIVFICHSLGGIVCKKALVIAHENSRYTNILQSTKAIVFFGTPHAGSEHADLLSVVAKIISGFGSMSMIDRVCGKIRKSLIRDLGSRSGKLEEISISFTERIQNLDIISFYEEYAISPLTTPVVQRSSARIGVPNEDLIPLSGDHKDMCRIDNEHTLAYRRIIQVCQKHGEVRYQPDEARPLDLQEQKCLMALNTIDMKECRAQLHPRTPGSFEWILSNMAFRNWMSNSSSTLLHLIGGMGTGKSILTSFLADRIKPLVATATSTALQKVTVCSFFCDDKDIDRKNGREIIRSLLHQILEQRHDLIQHATARFSQIAPNPWSLNLLWETLSDITLDPMAGTIVVIIDAIDECEIDSRDRVIAMIWELLARKPKSANSYIKFLISSRPIVDLMEEVQQYSTSISLDNEDSIKDTDIPLAVRYQLNELATNIQWPAETREPLEKSIVKKAERNFLWVRLVIQRLKNGPQTTSFFQRIVDESPKELDGMYCCILSDINIEHQTLASKVLRVLVASLRPLATPELRLALAINQDHRTLKSVEEDSDMAIERTIRLALGSLIRVYDSKVRFIHQSVKEFLLRLSTGSVANLKSIKPNLQTLYGVNQHAANLELAIICIAFLGLSDFNDNRVLNEDMLAFNELPGATEDNLWFLPQQGPNSSQLDYTETSESFSMSPTTQAPVLFKYSACYWTSHLSASSESIPKSVIMSAIRLLHRGTNCLDNWSEQYRLSSVDFVALPQVLDPLIASAFFGLAQLTNEMLENYPYAFQDQSRPLALTWACRMGHTDIVQALLKHKTSQNGISLEGGSPLSWVCANGHLEIAKMLLDESNWPQVNGCDGNGRTPLSLAVGCSHLQIAKMLLSREDIEVNIVDRTRSPPLFWAVGSKPQGQDLAMLKLLISEPRVDISQRDRYGRTVLSWAAEMGALEAVNIIIQSQRSGVQILLSDLGDSDKGWSPLSWAAFHGHYKVVQALCETGRVGTQLASVDKRGQNAISLAADRGHAEVIKVLAKYCPEGIDLPEEFGRTPLSCAMWGNPGNEDTIRVLLQTRLVDVNRKASNGRTALSYAVSAGRADLVRILVEEGGADLNVTDNDGNILREMNIDWRSSQVKEEIDRLTNSRGS